MHTLLRALWVLFLLIITALGVWLASSLVAFAGGPAELALLCGVLLFPVLPLWWEKRATDAFYAKLRRSTRLLPKKRAFTGWTRFALRTVFVNLVFLAALVALWPKVVFAALVTRGDWFLGDSPGRVGAARQHGVDRHRLGPRVGAPRLAGQPQQEARRRAARARHRAAGGGGGDALRQRPALAPEGQAGTEPVEPTPEPPTPETPPPEEVPAWTVGSTSWPWARAVHPVVAGMTAADETSPESVARYISARVTDPFERVKALHDWVVTRLRYDQDSITGVRKKQDAQSVFLSRLGRVRGLRAPAGGAGEDLGRSLRLRHRRSARRARRARARRPRLERGGGEGRLVPARRHLGRPGDERRLRRLSHRLPLHSARPRRAQPLPRRAALAAQAQALTPRRVPAPAARHPGPGARAPRARVTRARGGAGGRHLRAGARESRAACS